MILAGPLNDFIATPNIIQQTVSAHETYANSHHVIHHYLNAIALIDSR